MNNGKQKKRPAVDMGSLHPKLIIGIGGSAGALNAYKAILDATPSTTDFAFVIISHLSPNAHSYLAEILSRHTKMKVMVASMAMPIRANHVYVIPSDADLLIENYTFKVISPRSSRNKQIDLFFISLAEAMGVRAIGIVLSGYDGDGTEGCKHIQANGGKTFAQDISAEVDSMPLSVQAAGFADFVIPLDQISGILKSLAELVIANEEKAKREAELVIANKEIAKRAAELIVVQKDVRDLEVLNTHKESVLATLSHDLRSPLGNIIGIADYLKSDFDNMEPSEVKELINVLLKASTEELNMLDSLVEWARIKYASEAFTPSKIRLGEFVHKVLSILNKNATANNIQIDNEIGNGIFVFADDKMLLCILQNIVLNSIKHTPSGGKVTLSAKRSEDKIIVDIKDTGIGMSKEMQENLFTPQMEKLSNVRKENKGAGIGLLLVKGFIEKHGGKIWVESEVGRGSDFKFTIPIFNEHSL